MDGGLSANFRLLGPFEAVVGGRHITNLRRQERCVLAVLLWHAGHVVPVDRLAELVWDGDPQAGAAALRTYVSRVRTALARADIPLVRKGAGYLLTVERDRVDVHRFGALVERAREVDDPVRRSHLLREALGLWRGPPFVDAGSDLLRTQVGGRLEALRDAALDLRVAADLSAGRHHEVVTELTELTAVQPSSEHLAGHLMVALYRCGRRSEALTVYRRTRAALIDDLGIEPGPELQRLHTEILRADPKLDTAVAVPGVVAQVPRQLPGDVRGFAGRVGELTALDAVMASAAESPTSVLIAVVSGTAGVGKTALAVHWAHRVADRFPDGQLYVNMRGFDAGGSAVEPAEAVRGFLDALGVPPDRIPASPQAQIGQYRSQLAGRRALVLLDNAHDAEQVRPLLPGTPGCMVIITSRNSLSGLVASDGARPVALDLLTAGEARDLLVGRLGADRVNAEHDIVGEIIDWCARLPLALVVVAARALTRGRRSLPELAADMRDARSRLDTLAGRDTATDVRTVFSWSYQTLSPAAAWLFRLTGLHPAPEFGAAAAASLTGRPVAEVRRLLAELIAAGLLEESAPDRYTCHELLRAYAGELTHTHDPAGGRNMALHRMLDHYLHTAHAAAALLNPHRAPINLVLPQPGAVLGTLTDQGSATAWFRAERVGLLAAARLAVAAGFDDHPWQLALTMADYLDWQGHWHDLVAVLEVALAALRRLNDLSTQARIHRALAHALSRLDRQDEVSTHVRQALDLSQRMNDLPGMAKTHNYLIHLYEQQGRYGDMLTHAEQALELHRATGDQVWVGRALNALGWTHAMLAEHSRALECCREALTVLQAAGDPVGEANTWHSVGYIHHHTGNYNEAATCYQRALTMFGDAGNRFDQANTLDRLGATYLAAGDHQSARTTWRRALDIVSELDHPGTSDIQAKLSSAALQSGVDGADATETAG